MKRVAVALLTIAALAGPASARDTAGLVIQSGETWIFQVQQGQPVNAHKAGADAKPAAGEFLVTLSLQNGTMMQVVNNTDKFYNYRAFMLKRPDDKGQRTSVCTLMSNGRMGFENWPYAIPAIRLSDFIEAGENSMQCQ